LAILLFTVGAIGWRALRAPSAPGAQWATGTRANADAHGDSDEEGSAKVTLTEAQRKKRSSVWESPGQREKKCFRRLEELRRTGTHATRCAAPGVVRAMNKRLGDKVEKGELLATVESNESLRTYEIVS
jgi:cobalt-zinc-cadmium efflux system membrane fusion protein